MQALDNCRGSIFDSADTLMIKDEGTVLRRLMGVYSLRPTVVSISSVVGSLGLNYSLNTLGMGQVTTIPIINMRIPPNYVQMKYKDSIHLNAALEQSDWYIENKMLVPKRKNIIHCRDVLIFYINRRHQSVNFAKLVAPYNFTALPITSSGFETLNEAPVNFDRSMIIGNDNFSLRSVVMVEKSKLTNMDPSRDVHTSLIIGCSTCVISPANYTKGFMQDTYFLYDPLGSSVKYKKSKDVYEFNSPITIINAMQPMYNSENQPQAFEPRAQKRGTIFVYVKCDSSHGIFRN